MAKKGREQFEPDEKQRELVAILAGHGIPQETICTFIFWGELTEKAGKPITPPTLRKAFRLELDNGKHMRDSKLLRTAFEMATVDKVPSVLIFLLKTQVGLKEPASEVHLHTTYGELVKQAVEKGEEQRKAALTVIQGGKAA